MIDDALRYIRIELRDYLAAQDPGVTNSLVRIESARALSQNNAVDGAFI